MDCFPTVCIYFFFFLFIFIGSPQKVIIITIFDTHLALYLFFFSSFSLSRCLRRRFWQKERPQKRKERNPKQPQKKDSKKKKKKKIISIVASSPFPVVFTIVVASVVRGIVACGAICFISLFFRDVPCERMCHHF